MEHLLFELDHFFLVKDKFNYSKCPDFDFNLIKSHLWPYTSSFIQKFPEILLYFILLIDGISKSEKFLHDASIRLKRTQNFCNVKLDDQFKLEKEFWENFILRTHNILDVKSSLREIIYSMILSCMSIQIQK